MHIQRIISVLSLSHVGLATAATLRADIRADTNRDGVVDLHCDSDVLGKNNWTEESGAIFLPAIGDTDRRCSRQALAGPALSNEELDDCHDASDNILRSPELLAPVVTRPMRDVSEDASASVYVVDELARNKTRVFRKQNDDEWIFADADYKFKAEELRAGLILGIDGRDIRRPNGWDGKATIRFVVNDGVEIAEDEVTLRVAPLLTHHHLQDVEQVLAVQGNSTQSSWILEFTQDLMDTTREAGLTKPTHLFNASDDIWAQDFVEPGYAAMPGPDGPVSIRLMIRSPQDSRVAGRQLFEHFRRHDVGAVQHLGGARDEINSGGNIETVPPHEFNGKSWPAGRVILGNHGKQKHHIYELLRAQETQDPILLETGWLSIGHVDEFLQFLPFNNKRGWKVMVDSPLAGLDLLKKLQADGHGDVRAYSRENDTVSPGTPSNPDNWFNDPIPVPSKSINEMLADEELFLTNHACAERIAANIEILKKEVGLEHDDFVSIPALFEQSSWSNSTELQVGALFPGVINNLVLTGYKTCVAPNPWGPVVDGKDVLAEAIRAQYEKFGLSVEFVDDWNTHHNYGGEVHCGTNTLRENSQWW